MLQTVLYFAVIMQTSYTLALPTHNPLHSRICVIPNELQRDDGLHSQMNDCMRRASEVDLYFQITLPTCQEPTGK